MRENVKLWFLHLDSAPAQRSVLVKDFLAKNNVTTLQHPPYSPDLAPADSYPFPQLKSAMKERRFCDANETLRMQSKSRKGFYKWLPGMFPTPLQSLAEVCFCTRKFC
jgi:transposase